MKKVILVCIIETSNNRAEEMKRKNKNRKAYSQESMTRHPVASGKSSFDLVDLDVLFNSLPLKDDSVFLDLACGTGLYALKAAKLTVSGIVYAVDLWAEGISALIAEMAHQQIKNVWAAVADATIGLPLATGTVDVCLLAAVLHDFNQEKTTNEVIDEVVRILKPGGSLAVIEFKLIDPPPGPPLSIRMSPEQVDQILSPLGFCDRIVCDLGPRLYLAQYKIEK